MTTGKRAGSERDMKRKGERVKDASMLRGKESHRRV